MRLTTERGANLPSVPGGVRATERTARRIRPPNAPRRQPPCGLVLPRSGLAAKHGISVVNGPGLIDPGYRGELKVVLVNLGAESFAGAAGDQIAQLLVVPFAAPELLVVDALPPGPDGRGAGGFGSTGR